MEGDKVVRRSRAGRIARRAGCMVFLGLLLVLAIFIWWRYYFTYSDGERYGLLQKISHKGGLFKTYEGEIILSPVGNAQNIPIAAEKFLFSVTDENVAKQLSDMQGRRVTVHYQQKNSSAFWRGDSEFIVDSVRSAPQ